MSDERYKVELFDPRPKSSRGGQHAGLPHMGVKITDTATGNFAMSIDQRSQHKNKIKAMEALQWMELH